MPVVQSKILHLEKDATVAERRGELDQRRHQLHAGGDQPGNAAIAGVVVTDTFTTNEAPVLKVDGIHNVGDADNDSLLNVSNLAVHGQPSGDAGRAQTPARPSVNTAEA